MKLSPSISIAPLPTRRSPDRYALAPGLAKEFSKTAINRRGVGEQGRQRIGVVPGRRLIQRSALFPVKTKDGAVSQQNTTIPQLKQQLR